MHGRGFAHRDIKLDNISIDANFNLKILDFGYARDIKGDNSEGFVETRAGTPMYMCPEVESSQKYKAIDADLFATAVTLFVLKLQQYPWERTLRNDSSYTYWANHQTEDWWQQRVPGCTMDDPFVDLMNKTLAYDNFTRLSLADFVAHPYMRGPTMSQEEV